MKFHTKEALGIYYINGMLSAEVIYRGKITRTWEHPLPVIEEDELETLLPTIPGQLNFVGYKVSMIIAAPPIEYHILPVPAMKKSDILRFCRWKAETLKGKNHTWSYTRLNTTHHKGNICLHLIPSVYQRMFIQFCRKTKLELQHLLTIPAVVSGLLEKAESSDGTVEMVALVTDRVTYFVIGIKNAPVFIREIPFSWSTADSSECIQFGREIKRTTLFIKRQFDKEISVLRIKGKEASRLGDALAEAEVIQPTFDETPVHLFEAVVGTTLYRTDNLLPFDMLGSRTRAVRTLFLAIALVLFIAALITSNAFTNTIFDNVERNIENSSVQDDLTLIRDSIDYYTSCLALIEAEHKTAEYVDNLSAAPFIGYFFCICPDILPDNLVLSRIAVTSAPSKQFLNIEIEGTCPADPASSALLLETFEQRLRSNPIHMHILESWRILWLINLHEGGGNEQDPFSRRFRISGRLK